MSLAYRLHNTAKENHLHIGWRISKPRKKSIDDGFCTLREAINNANNDLQQFSTTGECAAGSGTDTITFDTGLSSLTIYLGSSLIISSNMTIDGSVLASQITISGDSDNNGVGDLQLIRINDSGGTAALDSLIITKGAWPITGSGMRNTGTLLITNSTFSNNTTTGIGFGGAIYNTGTLTITDSTFSANSAINGGVYNAGGQ